MKERQPSPTKAESAILGTLWNRGPSTVREVHEALAGSKSVGYTTTLKAMQVMVAKGLLTREPLGKAHLYSPREQAETAKTAFVADVVDRLFAGSTADLVLHALSGPRATSEELQKIRAMLDRIGEP